MPFSPTLPTSLPLDADQRKVEVRALFETSLARIQIDLRDHMQGAKNEIGFANHIDSAFMDMCASYKLPKVGWRNVNVWPFRTLLLLVVCVYLLSFETPWSEEPQLIVEALWESTVLKLLYWQGWMPVGRERDSDMSAQNGDVGMYVVRDDAGQELPLQYIIGGDEGKDEYNK